MMLFRFGLFCSMVALLHAQQGAALTRLLQASQLRSAVPAVPVSSRIVNLSVATQISAPGTALTVGVIIAGPDPKRMLIRGIGPTLSFFGVPNALATPRLRLFDGTGKLLTTVTNWGDDPLLAQAFLSTGAFPLMPASADAALLRLLAPGGYSAQVDGDGYGLGTVLAEFYDADPDVANSNSRLGNLSARGVVNPGAPLTAGFVVSQTTGEYILLRGVGPSLFTFGIRGYVLQPQLTLFDGTGTVIMTNAGWNDDPNLAAAFAAIGAFPLLPGSVDAAMRVFLAPGRYTAQVSDAAGGSGLAMVEIYESP